MKKTLKKLISMFTAFAMVLPALGGLSALAENSDGTIADQTQPLTVVGKRITGDNTYFEISLEVNDNHDDYSSVGVVLRYDPDYIIPAASWDEGAGAADMSENTSWATRRALPTLGLETWSTHTALAYQEKEPAAGESRKYGYLYLGAEHPVPAETETPASADPSTAPSSAPADPAADPEPTPTPGTRPVVVARFVYKTVAGDDTATPPIAEVTGAATRTSLETKWLDGTNNSGAAQPKNWDYDWTANEILTIAKDDIAGKSPAQYPFAIYTQNYEEKAYMETWPATPTPTPTPTAGDPTPTPMPASAYTPVIGAGIDPANHLTKDDIMVITCVGESAKATGGLKLSDIYTIVFFDWDDSILGTMTAGVGESGMAKTVSDYVESKWVHPALRSNQVNYPTICITPNGNEDILGNPIMQWQERQYSYRGEYPYLGPDYCSDEPKLPGGDYTYSDDDYPAEPDDPDDPFSVRGSAFPLTNKLDYVFGGKDIDPEHPFANGWTQVLTSEIDWYEVQAADATGETLPGEMPDYMPHSMENTFTAMESVEQIFDRPIFDEDGNFDWDTFENGIQIVSFDFDNITADTLKYSDGNLYVKAVYEPGEWLDMDGDGYYAVIGTEEDVINNISTVGPVSIGQATYSIEYQYRRINEAGYGVHRIHEPAINFSIMQAGASGSTPLRVDISNKEVINVQLLPTNTIDNMSYQLTDIFGANVVQGIARSAGDELGNFLFQGTDGLLFNMNKKSLLAAAANYVNKGTTPSASWPAPATLSFMFLSRNYDGMDYSNAAYARNAQEPLLGLIRECKTAGVDYNDLTWYQIQYALFQPSGGPYLIADPDETENWFWDNMYDVGYCMIKVGLITEMDLM